MSDGWISIGTVEILRLRIYPLDPMGDSGPLHTTVAVYPGKYPVYRKYDVYLWIMHGWINERNEKIADGLYSLNQGDMPTGPMVKFPSLTYGVQQFAELLDDPICQPGPQQRLEFHIDGG